MFREEKFKTSLVVFNELNTSIRTMKLSNVFDGIVGSIITRMKLHVVCTTCTLTGKYEVYKG